MALKVISACVKGVNVLVDGADIYACYHDENLSSWQKVHRIGTLTLYIVAQTGEIAAPFCENIDDDTKIQISLAAGGLEIAKTISKISCKNQITGGDFLDLFGIVVFRASEVARSTYKIKPQVFGEYKETVGCIADYCNAGALIIRERKSIEKAFRSLVNYCCPPNPDEITANAMPIELELTHNDIARMHAIRNTPNIGHFNRVPFEFEFDPVLRKYICPVSKKPIRHILVVKGTENLAEPTYYEAEEINKWFAPDGPADNPPRWPDNIPILQNNLECPQVIQEEINNRLNQILINFQQLQLDIREDPMYVQGRKIHIHENVSNTFVADEIMKGPLKDFFGCVNVEKMNYNFSQFHQSKPTRKITIKLRGSIKLGKGYQEIDCISAARAALGSEEDSDIEAWKMFLKSNYTDLKILLSQDLDTYRVTAK